MKPYIQNNNVRTNIFIEYPLEPRYLIDTYVDVLSANLIVVAAFNFGV